MKIRSILLVLVAIGLSQGKNLCGQSEKEAPDPDLKEMLDMANQMQKEANEMQKTNPSVNPGKKTSMAELQAAAKQQAAQMDQEEKLSKAKEDAALKKQLEASGPAVFPDWTPKMPEMKPDGPVTRKIIEDRVCTVLSGTSPSTPAQLGDAWEKEKTETVNIGRSNNIINDLKQVIIYVHPRDDFDKLVQMVAERRGNEKVTRVTITSPLPKPDLEGDE